MKRFAPILIVAALLSFGACETPTAPDFTSSELSEEVITKSNTSCPEGCLLQNGDCSC